MKMMGADGIRIVPAVARRLARIGLRELDDELGLWARDVEDPLVVVAP